MDVDVGQTAVGLPLGTTAYGGEVNLCCPAVGCGQECVGVERIAHTSEGHDTLDVTGECGHRMRLTFAFHKGVTLVTTTRLADSSSP